MYKLELIFTNGTTEIIDNVIDEGWSLERGTFRCKRVTDSGEKWFDYGNNVISFAMFMEV